MKSSSIINFLFVLMGFVLIGLCAWFGSLIQNGMEKNDPDQQNKSHLRFRMVGGLIGGSVAAVVFIAVFILTKRPDFKNRISKQRTSTLSRGGTITLDKNRTPRLSLNAIGQNVISDATTAAKASRIVENL